MKFKEIDTKRINRNRLSIQVDRFFSSIKIYGKCDNKIFMMIDQNAGVFDLDKNKFIISDRRGIAYPVVDKNNNNYFMVINDEFNNKSYFVDYDKPKFRDSSNCYMYDMDYKPYTLECFCNIFDENNNNVQPMNKYLSNIYRFTNHVYGDGEIKNITYRDSDEDCNYSNLDNAYSIYDDLPTNISKNFKLISSSYSLKKTFEKQIKSINKDNFNLDVVYKKWKYSVINPNKGLIISFDNNIKNIEIIDNDIILLTRIDNKCALYDVTDGYLINFDDDITFNTAYKLCDKIFAIQNNDKFKLLMNGRILPETYSDIYMILDNIIVMESFKKVEFYNLDGKLIFSANSSSFYKLDEDIFYCEENIFYHYNFKSGIKKTMNIFCPFELEDGSKTINSIDDILQDYNYYYDSWDNDDFVLFKEKKWGIELDLEYHNNRVKQWFNSKEERQKYFQVLLDTLVNLPIDDTINTDNAKKRIKK